MNHAKVNFGEKFESCPKKCYDAAEKPVQM